MHARSVGCPFSTPVDAPKFKDIGLSAYIISNLFGYKRIDLPQWRAPLPYVFSIFSRPVLNFKMRSNHVLEDPIPGVIYSFPVKHSSFRYLERPGKPREPSVENRRFSVGRCNFSFQQHTEIIPTATTTFSTTAVLTMTMSTSPTLLVTTDSRWWPPNRN